MSCSASESQPTHLASLYWAISKDLYVFIICFRESFLQLVETVRAYWSQQTRNCGVRWCFGWPSKLSFPVLYWYRRCFWASLVCLEDPTVASPGWKSPTQDNCFFFCFCSNHYIWPITNSLSLISFCFWLKWRWGSRRRRRGRSAWYEWTCGWECVCATGWSPNS